MKKLITVYGMTSEDCRKMIQMELEKLEGITHFYIRVATSVIEVEFDHKLVTLDKIKKIITDLGYDPM